jgi:hypothetical protein
LAVAISFGNFTATAFIDFTRAVAYAARIKFTYAIVDLIADSIAIHVDEAVTIAIK